MWYVGKCQQAVYDKRRPLFLRVSGASVDGNYCTLDGDSDSAEGKTAMDDRVKWIQDV